MLLPCRRRAWALSVAVLLLTVCDSLAQRPRARRPREQTSFGAETPIDRPVKLPAVVVKQLLEFEDGRLKQCLQNSDETAADVPKHFTASEADINGDGARDLVVQAESLCFMGAHLTTWWVFSKTESKFGMRVAPGYDLVFSGRGDGLSILKATTYGFRDIETVNFAGAGSQFYTTVWKFDGSEYKARLCTVESGGKKSRVKCDW
jgi:hypothetical protein